MPTPSLFSSVINSYLPEPQASLLNGILFGLPLKATQEFYRQLRMVGLLHLVVLSGINITLLGSIVAVFTRSFGKLLSALITVLVIILFILFVRPQAPIVRAGFMGIVTFVSFIFGRKTAALYVLFLSALFIVIFWPSWLRTISFQLSYGATLGLIFFGNTKEQRYNDAGRRLLFLFWREIKPSLAAQLGTVPLIFIHFRQISLIAPLANLLVSFLIAPLMIFGFLTAILGKISWPLGLIPGYICLGLLSYMVWVIKFLSQLPFIFFTF